MRAGHSPYCQRLLRNVRSLSSVQASGLKPTRAALDVNDARPLLLFDQRCDKRDQNDSPAGQWHGGRALWRSRKFALFIGVLSSRAEVPGKEHGLCPVLRAATAVRAD
jgi:hypothetical protein